MDGGLDIATARGSRDKLIEYLTRVDVARRARSVTATGWHGHVYVAPWKVYGDTQGEAWLQAQGADVPQEAGTYDGWRSMAALAVGNSRVALALATAFAGPLLHLVGEESFGFHFAGGTSSGKSTALHVASSVWGDTVNSWRTTDNAAEGMARAANHRLLLMDEMSQVDGRAADAMAYMLGNGSGKARARRDSSVRSPTCWLLVFLSSGEIGLAEKIGEAGKTARAGQAVRLIEIPADAGQGLRLFETLHHFPTGDALSRHLKEQASRHRRHAADRFLEALTGHVVEIADEVRAEVESWLQTHAALLNGADGQVIRVARRFALVAAAGQLALDLGILPWPDGEAGRAASVCFRAWIERRGGVGAAEDSAGLAQVRGFIAAYGMSARFIDTEAKDYAPPPRDKTLGFRTQKEGEQTIFRIQADMWKEVCKGLDSRAVAADLLKRGLIIPGEGGKTQTSWRIPHGEKVRVYVIKSDILDGGSE